MFPVYKLIIPLAVSILGRIVCTAAHTTEQISVVWNEKQNGYEILRGKSNVYVAYGAFQNDINSTGWSYLELSTNPKENDLDQAYAAGLIEGILTDDLIKWHAENTLGSYCTKPYSAYCQRLLDFILKNFDWMQQQIDQHADKDPYWYQVKLFLAQTQGLIDGFGFNDINPVRLKNFRFKPDISSLLIFQINGDLEDLEQALHAEGKVHVVGNGACSALIKLLPGNKDLYTSQDTWTGYETMLRILKKYNFAFRQLPEQSKVIPGSAMTFSSYPATLFSGDDFYAISSGLVSIETTIGNSNASRWSFIKPDTVLEGIRNMVANRLASTGKEWVDIFSRYNSGTYNNEWMIVDYKKFVPSDAHLQEGLLYVLEQIPGMIMSRDVTDVLQSQTYWASYNAAYFPEIFNASGGQEQVAKYGDWFSYDKTPRARIFRRDHVKVKDEESMMRLMRYNDYKNDPLSACNCTPPYSAENSISARCDLNPANGTYPFGALGHRSHGGTDMKLTSSSLVTDLQFIGISGPTWDSLPPFQWSKSDYGKTVKHLGHPDLWTFKPDLHVWSK